MIVGAINANLEAMVSLTVLGSSHREQIDAVLDTGFSGYLTLPASIIATLQMAFLGRAEGILADGRADYFDVYRATVIWDGQPRTIEVESVDCQPLLGMAMLRGHSLHANVVSGGPVTIAPLP